MGETPQNEVAKVGSLSDALTLGGSPVPDLAMRNQWCPDSVNKSYCMPTTSQRTATPRHNVKREESRARYKIPDVPEQEQQRSRGPGCDLSPDLEIPYDEVRPSSCKAGRGLQIDRQGLTEGTWSEALAPREGPQANAIEGQETPRRRSCAVSVW